MRQLRKLQVIKLKLLLKLKSIFFLLITSCCFVEGQESTFSLNANYVYNFHLSNDLIDGNSSPEDFYFDHQPAGSFEILATYTLPLKNNISVAFTGGYNQARLKLSHLIEVEVIPQGGFDQLILIVSEEQKTWNNLYFAPQFYFDFQFFDLAFGPYFNYGLWFGNEGEVFRYDVLDDERRVKLNDTNFDNHPDFIRFNWGAALSIIKPIKNNFSLLLSGKMPFLNYSLKNNSFAPQSTELTSVYQLSAGIAYSFE